MFKILWSLGIFFISVATACKCNRGRILCTKYSRITDISIKCGQVGKSVSVFWYGIFNESCPQRYKTPERFVFRISPLSICFGVKWPLDSTPAPATTTERTQDVLPQITTVPTEAPFKFVMSPAPATTTEKTQYVLRQITTVPTEAPFKFVMSYRSIESWNGSMKRRSELMKQRRKLSVQRNSGFYDLERVTLESEYVTLHPTPVSILEKVSFEDLIDSSVNSTHSLSNSTEQMKSGMADMLENNTLPWILLAIVCAILFVTYTILSLRKCMKHRKGDIKKRVRCRSQHENDGDYQDFLDKLHLPSPNLLTTYNTATFSTFFIVTILGLISNCAASPPMRAFEKCECYDRLYSLCDSKDNPLQMKIDSKCEDVEMIYMKSDYSCKFEIHGNVRNTLGLAHLKKIVFPPKDTECRCYCGDHDVEIIGCNDCAFDPPPQNIPTPKMIVDVNDANGWIMFSIGCICTSVGAALSVYISKSKCWRRVWTRPQSAELQNVANSDNGIEMDVQPPLIDMNIGERNMRIPIYSLNDSKSEFVDVPLINSEESANNDARSSVVRKSERIAKQQNTLNIDENGKKMEDKDQAKVEQD